MAKENDSAEGLSWDDSKASSYVEKAGAPKYQPVDYAKGTASSAHLSRNKPDKVMAISGGHAARSALDKNYLTCKATEGGSSCKPATTYWQAPGEYMEQATPVCDKHAEQLSKNALSRENNLEVTTGTQPTPQTWKIKPRDVARETLKTAKDTLAIRTTLELGLYSKGMRGEDAIFNRKNINVGQPGPEALWGGRRGVENTINDAREFGGHQNPLPTRGVDPETGEYEPEERHPDYLRKKGIPMSKREGPVPRTNKEKNARGGKASNKVVEPPKLLANTFNSDGSPAYGHTVDQPIGFGAGDIDHHPEKYPLEVESHKNHVQQPRARGFSKENNRATKVTIGMPFKPEYPGGVQKFLSEQEESDKRAAIDFTETKMLVPGSSRATAFELAQEEGRGGSERYKAIVAKNTAAIEAAKKTKEIE